MLTMTFSIFQYQYPISIPHGGLGLPAPPAPAAFDLRWEPGGFCLQRRHGRGISSDGDRSEAGLAPALRAAVQHRGCDKGGEVWNARGWGDGKQRGLEFFLQFSNFLVSKMMDYLNLWHIAGGTDVEMNQNLQYWDYDLWSFFFFSVAMQMGQMVFFAPFPQSGKNLRPPVTLW